MGLRRGAFITFEGPDGTGKTTQTRRLAQALEGQGYETLLTREPGGSEGAESIRSLLTTGRADRWSAYTELLLFNAARRDHLEKTIEPALSQEKIVICDRFVDSTRVYQGATRGDLRGLVDELHRLVIGKEADLTLILDMDPKKSLERGLARQSGEDRFEEFGLDFQLALRRGFLELAKQEPKRCIVVNADQDVEAVCAQVYTHVSNVL